MSLKLHEGIVIFRVNYDRDTWLELNSTNAVNKGRWSNVKFIRAFDDDSSTEEGALTVNGIRINGSPNRPIDYHNVPNLLNTNYYFGGVPPGFDKKLLPKSNEGFLGCMKEIQIGTETQNPLESINAFGIEAGCKDIVSKAGFNGNGFVELPSYSLRRRASFGFVFRTLQPDGLLLLAAHPPNFLQEYDERSIFGNYSVNLIDGKIHVKIDAGLGAILLTSNITLNDGNYHVVSISKMRRKFELRINDQLQSTKKLNMTIDGVILPENKGGMFLGGAPKAMEFINLAPLNPFKGLIKDIVFNNKTVSFARYISR